MSWKPILPVRFFAGRRVAVAAVLAIALAAIPLALVGLNRLRPGCPAGTSTPSHQPIGYECTAWVTTWDFTSFPPNTAIVLSDVSDGSAPSPRSALSIAISQVADAVRTPTMLPGGSVVPEAALGLHFGLRVKPAAIWRDHPTDLSMGIALTSPEGARATLLLYTVNEDGRLLPGLRLRKGVGDVVALAPDFPVDPVEANRWHQWEVGIRRDGEGDHATIEWWVDGALVGRHEGLTLWEGPFTAATAQWTLEASGLAAAGTYARVDDAYVGMRPASDRLILESEARFDPGQTIVLFDGRTARAPAECTNDGVLRGAEIFHFGNLLSSADCPDVDEETRFSDEIAVLSRHNAFLLVTDHRWTDEPGETLTRQLVDPVAVPVTVWIAAAPEPGEPSYPEMADRHVKDAVVLLEQNRVGLTIGPVVVNDRSGDVSAQQLIGTRCREDLSPPPPPLFDPLSINVYYVRGDYFGDPGWSCHIAAADGSYTESVIFIYVEYNPYSSTLAHELGHAFSLEHVGEAPDELTCFTPAASGYTNLMWAGGAEDRSLLTAGQVFRMNTGRASFVNRVAGLREGPTRDCPKTCEDRDGACPRVAKQ